MHLKYDETVDAIYVHLSDGPITRTAALSDEVNLDYDAEGRIVGVEIFGVSDGVNVHGLPYSAELARLLEAHDIRILHPA